MIITYTIEIDNSKFESFSEMTEKVFTAVMECGCEIIKQQLEKLDAELLMNRDKKRYRAKGLRKTSVKTKLGTIEYNRRIYHDTEAQKHIFLLDEAV